MAGIDPEAVGDQEVPDLADVVPGGPGVERPKPTPVKGRAGLAEVATLRQCARPPRRHRTSLRAAIVLLMKDPHPSGVLDDVGAVF